MVLKNYPSQAEVNPSLKNYPIEIAYWDKNLDPYQYKVSHKHEFDEVLFFRKGGGEHEIDFNEYLIQDCSIHLVRLNTVHFLNRDKKSEGFNIAFDTYKIEESNPSIRFPFLNYKKPVNIVKNLRKDQFDELEKIMEILSYQIKGNNEFYKNKCFLIAFELLINKLASHFLSEKNVPDKSDELSPLVSRFLRMVNKFGYSEHKVTWYSQVLHVSMSHLYRMCIEEINLSPKEYIQQFILNESRKLLCQSRFNCKQVALELGFDNASHFHSFFKSRTGFTPGAYKEKIQQSNLPL